MKRSEDGKEDSYFIVEPCASASGFEIKLKNLRIDMKKAEEAISEIGQVGASMPVVLVAKVDGISISVYASGRIMMKRSGSRISASVAQSLAGRLMDALKGRSALIPR